MGTRELEEMGNHRRCLSRGGAVLLFGELSLGPVEWAILDTLKGAEGMPLQNGNNNSENELLGIDELNQRSQIICLSYCFPIRGINTPLVNRSLKTCWALG